MRKAYAFKPNDNQGVISMLLERLIHRFLQEKNYSPLHTNELLDFVQKKYIQEDFSIVEYKKLFFELDKLKAEKPSSYMFNTTVSFGSLEIPS